MGGGRRWQVRSFPFALAGEGLSRNSEQQAEEKKNGSIVSGPSGVVSLPETWQTTHTHTCTHVRLRAHTHTHMHTSVPEIEESCCGRKFQIVLNFSSGSQTSLFKVSHDWNDQKSPERRPVSPGGSPE